MEFQVTPKETFFILAREVNRYLMACSWTLVWLLWFISKNLDLGLHTQWLACCSIFIFRDLTLKCTSLLPLWIHLTSERLGLRLKLFYIYESTYLRFIKRSTIVVFHLLFSREKIHVWYLIFIAHPQNYFVFLKI